MSQEETISLYQPLLYSVAYNILGRVADAEDIVQDTFLKWFKVDHQKIENSKAYLVKSVKNACINHINVLQRRKEVFFETVDFSQFVGKLEMPNFDLKNEISEAIGILLKKLEPSERAVFLLKEVFDYDYNDLTEVLDKTKDNCRQLLSRAKDKLKQEKSRFNFSTDTRNQFLDNFYNTTSFGEIGSFLEGLKKDISDKIVLKK